MMANVRYTAELKAALIECIRSGQVERETAKRHHDLSEEELAAWERDYDALGITGLRTTRKPMRGRMTWQ